MQASIEKRKNENEISNLINISQEKPVKKLSRHSHYNKKQKLEKEQNSTLLAEYNMSRPILPLITSNIIFDPEQTRLANIELSDISPNFFLLVDKEIIKMEEHGDANPHPDDAKNKRLWVAL
ncbi:32472_t:CDS:2, partial [Racocetra persica]